MNNNSKTVNILGTTYIINYFDHLPKEEKTDYAVMGECSSDIQEIHLATKLPNGTEISQDELRKNLLHEILHAILNEGQYSAVSDDEPLVEWVARCLNSVLQQKVL